MSGGARRRRPLGRSFYARETEVVARELLGTILVSSLAEHRVEGRIVETEAYVGPHDPASHAAERIGRTARNEPMFGAAGTAYVYRIYGVHWCLNAVTREKGYPAAVLIRAIEPLYGTEVMRERRWPGREHGPDRLIANGPGKLADALAITGALNTHDLRLPPLQILDGDPVADSEVEASGRIGITRAVDWPLRFTVRDSRFLSR